MKPSTSKYTDMYAKMQADYDEIAKAFAVSRKGLHWSELDQMIDEVEPGSKVLDVGCGSGRLCDFFEGSQVDYYGMDISKHQIAGAKKACPTGKFKVASMIDLPYQDNEFNYVFLVASLHHVPSQEDRLKSLQEASRVLKKGGKLFITVKGMWQKKFRPLFWSKEGRDTVSDHVKNSLTWRDVFWPWRWQTGKTLYRYYHAFTKKELRSLVTQTDLEVERIDYMSKGEVKRWWEGNNLVCVSKKKV